VSSWRDWVPDAAVGAVVLGLGLAEALRLSATDEHERFVVIAVAMGVAVGLSRRAPAAGLAILVGIGLVHVESDTALMAIEVAALIVIFGTARWGRPATAVAGLLISIVAGLAGPGYMGWRVVRLAERLLPASLFESLWSGGRSASVLLGGVALIGVLAAWLAGLALRFLARAETSQRGMVQAEEHAERARRESAQAQEIARLRDEQAKLARDVHDVVGHSLAVILAQAESAQFVDDADTGKLKATMQTIADSARGSLRDVREVLSSTREPTVRPGGLDELIDGIRGSGHQVEVTDVGTPRPLPPELDTVAYRVLQEMLTNAIRHGRRDAPVRVERDWNGYAGDLRLEVTNLAEQGADETQPIATAPSGSGQGLAGMRRRLDSVGGHLDVRRKAEARGSAFTVTAWIPTGGSR